MILAILMGLLGHLCASFITIFGAFGILQVLGMWKGSLGFYLSVWLFFAVLRGILLIRRTVLVTILLHSNCWH